mmetsp:Transcript_38522/g.79011  ORF Transcript_38522/g.79011 Transcript_38522/m.79011 type:complete len:234 (-) Transcript_38522:254-955(-)
MLDGEDCKILGQKLFTVASLIDCPYKAVGDEYKEYVWQRAAQSSVVSEVVCTCINPGDIKQTVTLVPSAFWDDGLADIPSKFLQLLGTRDENFYPSSDQEERRRVIVCPVSESPLSRFGWPHLCCQHSTVQDDQDIHHQQGGVVVAAHEAPRRALAGAFNSVLTCSTDIHVLGTRSSLVVGQDKGVSLQQADVHARILRLRGRLPRIFWARHHVHSSCARKAGLVKQHQRRAC